MYMKLNSSAIRQEREKRAWSQEHLAGVTGLALRTIQRIESTGVASYESAGAIAAVFGLPVTALREGIEPTPAPKGSLGWFTWHRVFTLLGCFLVAAILTPPHFRVQIPVAVTLWLCCELAIKTRLSARRTGNSPS
jgi:transcriptional regulator with XRE-family HTH domain